MIPDGIRAERSSKRACFAEFGSNSRGETDFPKHRIHGLSNKATSTNFEGYYSTIPFLARNTFSELNITSIFSNVGSYNTFLRRTCKFNKKHSFRTQRPNYDSEGVTCKGLNHVASCICQSIRRFYTH